MSDLFANWLLATELRVDLLEMTPHCRTVWWLTSNICRHNISLMSCCTKWVKEQINWKRNKMSSTFVFGENLGIKTDMKLFEWWIEPKYPLDCINLLLHILRNEFRTIQKGYYWTFMLKQCETSSLQWTIISGHIVLY